MLPRTFVIIKNGVHKWWNVDSVGLTSDPTHEVTQRFPVAVSKVLPHIWQPCRYRMTTCKMNAAQNSHNSAARPPNAKKTKWHFVICRWFPRLLIGQVYVLPEQCFCHYIINSHKLCMLTHATKFTQGTTYKYYD